MKMILNAILFVGITVLSGCAVTPKAPVQVLTWEYVGTDCVGTFDDYKDLLEFKSWLDLRSIPLPEAKGMFIARILESERLSDVRKRQALALISLVELKNTTLGEIDENGVFLTASEYIDYVIEAYEIACG